VKAPRELTEAFRDGVDERESIAYLDVDDGTVPICWLAQFDKAGRPCEGRFERFHFLGHQRVKKALGLLLPELGQESADGREAPIIYAPQLRPPIGEDIIWAAEWDSRNGGIACEAHHRRFDSHLVPLPSEELVVPVLSPARTRTGVRF
jgi:hypothetical protein